MPRRWEDEQDDLRRFQEEAASSPASLFKNAAGRAAYDALMPAPGQIRANTPQEIAATTGPGLIRGAMAPRMASPEQQLAAQRERIAQAQLAQQDAEARMRYDIQQQQLNQEAQQQQQRGYLDMIRTGASIWQDDADRAQRAEQFERTGEEGAYRYDTTREDENRRFAEEQARRRFEFDTTREDEREQAINASNQRLYEFERGRLPSERDVFQVEAEHAMMQDRMMLESYYKAHDYGVRQQQEQAQIDDKLMRLKNDPNLAEWEKARIGKQLLYKYDELEAMKQETQRRGMEQEQQIELHRWQRQQKLENMTGKQRADWFQNRTVKLPGGREGWVDDKGNFNEFEPDRAQEQQIKMQEARRKAIDDQRGRLESSVQTRLDAKRKVFDSAYQREDARQDRMIQGLENQIAKIRENPKPKDDELSQLQELEAKKGLLEADREKNITERLKAAGHPGSHDEFEDWAAGQYQQAMMQFDQQAIQRLQTDEPPQQQTQQPPPPDEWGQFKQGQGYSIPPGTGGKPTTPRPEYDPLVNRQPYVPPQADGAGARPAAPAPAPQVARLDQDKQDLQAMVNKSTDPKAKQYGEAAAMILEEHGDFDRMPPGVQAAYIDLLKAIRGKRDVPPRAHEGRASGYGRTGTVGLPVGTAPFGR